MGRCNQARPVDAAGWASLLAVLGAVVLYSPAPWAGQIDSSAFFLLQRGMSESEILVRAGPPDLVTSPGQEAVEVNRGIVHRGKNGDVSFDSFLRTRIPTIAQWHYVPGPEETDPFITIITFRAGEVWELQRTKVFSRHKRPSAAATDDQGTVSDSDIRRERADNTLKAAEAYAATRAKLKGGDADTGPGVAAEESATIYKGVQPDGSTYFGDSPPGTRPKVISVD
jgi:hypothetical protein